MNEFFLVYLVLTMIGLVCSVYALFVFHKLTKDAHYIALCDISSSISCTRAFGSKYGKILGLPNGLYELLFYTAILGALFFEFTLFLVVLVSLGFVASLLLAYISYVRQHNFCLVCTCTYLVNTVLFLLVLYQTLSL